MVAEWIANKVFDELSHAAFSKLSGDYNPLHVDPIAARRTFAGVRIVHGIHLLIWALNAYVCKYPLAPMIQSLDVRFNSYIPVGTEINLAEERLGHNHIMLRAFDGSTCHASISIVFGKWDERTLGLPDTNFSVIPNTPLNVEISQIEGQRGKLHAQTTRPCSVNDFSKVAHWIGAERLAGLLETSRLIGMICPGLYSLYSGLKVNLVSFGSPTDLLYEMGKPRDRIVPIRICGAGLDGTLDSVALPAPFTQPSIESVSRSITRNVFGARKALVIGGSRGLGELTAKLLAAGGAKVIITYKSGQADAMRVHNEINNFGGECEVLQHDVEDISAAEIYKVNFQITHAYYFASPIITRTFNSELNKRLKLSYCRFFVDCFKYTCLNLHRLNPGIKIFYPSTAYIDRPIGGFSEYISAKHAAEELCIQLDALLSPSKVFSYRLPRLPTDQTNSPFYIPSENSIEAILRFLSIE